jgi:osmotically-inducible protein OsmY
MNSKINLLSLIFFILLLSGCTTTEIESPITKITKPEKATVTETTSIEDIEDMAPPTETSQPERKLQNILQDTKLAKAVKSELRKHPSLSQHSQITALTFDQEIYLIGSAETSQVKSEAEELISPLTDGKVYNLLLVGKISPNKTTDLWLTTKVKTWLMSSTYFTSNIQVVCFNNTVYLIGFADKTEIKALQKEIKKLIGKATLSSHLKIINKESTTWTH